MVFYVAQCKNQEEAESLNVKLIAACPTLIYSRILRKERDLDAFDADLLQSGDELVPLGAFTFSANELSAVRKIRRWLRRGHPLLIGASDDLPVDNARLPTRLHAYF